MHNWEEFALLLVSPSLCLWPGAWASHGNGTSRNAFTLLQGTSKDGTMGNIPLLKESHTARMTVMGEVSTRWHGTGYAYKEV